MTFTALNKSMYRLDNNIYSLIYNIYRLVNGIHGIEKISQIIIYRTEKRKIGQLFY